MVFAPQMSFGFRTFFMCFILGLEHTSSPTPRRRGDVLRPLTLAPDTRLRRGRARAEPGLTGCARALRLRQRPSRADPREDLFILAE